MSLTSTAVDFENLFNFNLTVGRIYILDCKFAKNQDATDPDFLYEEEDVSM